MIRSLLPALATLAFLVSGAQADFLIDNFSNLDTPNDMAASAANPNGGFVTVEAFSSGGTLAIQPANDLYTFGATTGESFTLLYDWAGLYENVPGASIGGKIERIEDIPLGILFGSLNDWVMTIDRGAAGSNSYTASSNIYGESLIGADQLAFTFEYTGAGASVILFGGADLIATPEPTSLMMLGSVAVVGLVRRRRR